MYHKNRTNISPFINNKGNYDVEDIVLEGTNESYSLDKTEKGHTNTKVKLAGNASSPRSPPFKPLKTSRNDGSGPHSPMSKTDNASSLHLAGKYLVHTSPERQSANGSPGNNKSKSNQKIFYKSLSQSKEPTPRETGEQGIYGLIASADSKQAATDMTKTKNSKYMCGGESLNKIGIQTEFNNSKKSKNSNSKDLLKNV